jgi:hypothetical protein
MLAISGMAMVTCITLSATVNERGGLIDSPYKRLLEKLGGVCPSSVGINLSSMVSEEVFKWFLASILLGLRIDEDIAAINTYREFERAGVLSVKAVIGTGRRGLVAILNQSGYIKHNHKIATRLLKATEELEEKYGGDFNRLHFFARGGRDLENKLRNLGNGIGKITAKIFLRGLRDIWDKVELPLSKPALLAAINLGLTHSIDASVALEELKAIWEQEGIRLSDLEAGLVKLDKNYCSQNKCPICPVRLECKNIGNKEVIKIATKPELSGSQHTTVT